MTHPDIANNLIRLHLGSTELRVASRPVLSYFLQEAKQQLESQPLWHGNGTTNLVGWRACSIPSSWHKELCALLYYSISGTCIGSDLSNDRGDQARHLMFSAWGIGNILDRPALLSLMRALSQKCSWKLTFDLVPVVTLLLAAVACLWFFKQRRSQILLLDFACYKPPNSLKAPLDCFLWACANFMGRSAPRQDSIDFQHKISGRNGLSEETYAPASMHRYPIEQNLGAAREEAQMVLFGSIKEVLDRTGVHPKQIGILVVNCSLFNPTPSLAAMIINQYKMREDINSYNLAGMGCSAGIIAIGLASQLLHSLPDSYALVVSTENMTQNWYTGNDRSMLVANTLFRMGIAAILLTNKPSERSRAKYELQHIVRVHLGSDDTAYQEDDQGIVGVSLNKEIVKVAARALQQNLTTLAPLVLPLSEQLKYVADVLLRKLGVRDGRAYQPSFTKAFDHFCLHAGGRGVIEGLGSQLGLTKRHLEPSFSSLYWFGNTSSASYWYAFGFIERMHGVRKGEKVWQVGFGSGFKTNSAVWKALRSFKDDRHKAWVCITPGDTERMWRDLEVWASTLWMAIFRLHSPNPKDSVGVRTERQRRQTLHMEIR